MTYDSKTGPEPLATPECLVLSVKRVRVAMALFRANQKRRKKSALSKPQKQQKMGLLEDLPKAVQCCSPRIVGMEAG